MTHDEYKLMTPEENERHTHPAGGGRGILRGVTRNRDTTKRVIQCGWCEAEVEREVWQGLYCSDECKREHYAAHD